MRGDAAAIHAKLREIVPEYLHVNGVVIPNTSTVRTDPPHSPEERGPRFPSGHGFGTLTSAPANEPA
jgi:hypothetical protein